MRRKQGYSYLHLALVMALSFVLSACGKQQLTRTAAAQSYSQLNPIASPSPVVIFPTPSPSPSVTPTQPPVVLPPPVVSPPPVVVIPVGPPPATPPPVPQLAGPCTLKITSQTVSYRYSNGNSIPEVTLKMLLGNILNAINYRVNDGGVRVIPANLLNGPMEISETVPLNPGANSVMAVIQDLKGNSANCALNYVQDYALNVFDRQSVDYQWDQGFYQPNRVIVAAGGGSAYGTWFFETASMNMPPLVGTPKRRSMICEENEVMVGRFAGNPDPWAASNDILCQALDPRLELATVTDTGLRYKWAVGARAYASASAIASPVLVGFNLNRNGVFGISFAYVKWRVQ